jgi:hypothetical protein
LNFFTVREGVGGIFSENSFSVERSFFGVIASTFDGRFFETSGVFVAILWLVCEGVFGIF